jgi:pilus assembly protein Flp/PilA
MLRLSRQLLAEECGATAIEYALIASLISVMVFAGSFPVGNNLQTIFSHVASAL